MIASTYQLLLNTWFFFQQQFAFILEGGLEELRNLSNNTEPSMTGRIHTHLYQVVSELICFPSQSHTTSIIWTRLMLAGLFNFSSLQMTNNIPFPDFCLVLHEPIIGNLQLFLSPDSTASLKCKDINSLLSQQIRKRHVRKWAKRHWVMHDVRE